MTATIHPVILCGGNGTRLWPLSSKAFPGQSNPLLGEKSLLQLTLERVAAEGRQDSPQEMAAKVGACRIDRRRFGPVASMCSMAL